MFELQDSKGNRFRLSRGGQSQEHAALALEGNPLQVKRLLKFCDSIALVRAYSFFYRSHSKSKKADGNATHAKRHRNTLLITRGNSQSITASNLPKAQRPSTRIPTPEERLFKAIASGELHLAQTHKVEPFNVTRAERELGLTRSKLLSDCNALILEKKRLASRGQVSLWGLVASSNAQNELKGQGARARIITLHYQRFCASLPNVKKIDGARDMQNATGSQGSAEIQARDMLKALGFSTTKVTTSQFQRAQQQLEQIWKSKNLYKQAREFSSDYAKTQKSTEKAAEKDLATYELTLSLLLCHDQPIHALTSPAPEQINLFSRYKTLGRGFWKAAETARAIEAERETIAGRATAASFDDLAAADNEERERTTPATALTFIEITLLDDKGEPIANEPYWVLDPEGNEHTGNLDGSGFARIDNIKPGNCQVAFPEIEGSGISQCRAEVDCCTLAVVEPEPAWAEFTLEDDDGNPIADEEYILSCPEGNEHTGKTDAEGKARVEGIKEGVCSVKFPNRDSDAVSRIPEKSKDNNHPSSNSSHTRTPSSGNSEQEVGNKTPSPVASDSSVGAKASSNSDSANETPSNSTANDECGTCTATSLTTTCSHDGRKAGASGILQVVASPNTTSTQEVAMLGVKVTLKAESGGSDKITSKLALQGNKSDSCFKITAPDGKQVSESSTSFAIDSPSNSNNSKWLAKATPTVSKVMGKGCSGSPQTITIESYPNTTYSIEGNLDIFKDWVEKVNKAWGDWGKRIFDVSPVSLTPKLTGPTGSFSGTWGWKEDKDWKAYYDASFSFGLNPIMEVGIELNCSMTKLAGTSAGIPPSLSSLAAEHIADIIVFAGAGCKGTLLGSPHVKLYPDGHCVIDGEAKFNVEGKVTLGIRGRIGSDYVVSASLILSGETKVIGEDALSISREGAEIQTTIFVEPLTAIAKVEVKYLVIFSKSKEKKWTPWQKFDLYKSEPKKLIG